MSSYISPGALIALGSALPVLGIIAVTLRYYARRVQKAPLLADDWLIAVALVTEVVLGASLIAGVAGHGLGYPTPRPATGNASVYTEISPEEALSSKVEFIFNIIEPLCLGLTKLSIVYFYRRVFLVHKRDAFDIATWVVIVLTVLFMAGFFLSMLFGCRTHPETWWAAEGVLMAECVNGLHWLVGFVTTDFVLDAIILLMPIVPIWRLTMPVRRRLAILLVFVVGALTFVASIIKMIIMIQVASGVEDSAVYQTEDPDILTAILLYWSALESGLGIIVACLPTCHTLFRKMSVDSKARSLLHLLSLRSTRSETQPTRTHKHDEESASNHSSGDGSHRPYRSVGRDKTNGMDTYPLGTLESQPRLPNSDAANTRRWDIEH